MNLGYSIITFHVAFQPSYDSFKGKSLYIRSVTWMILMLYYYEWMLGNGASYNQLNHPAE